MEYLKKSFTVALGKSKAFRDNYDAVFGKRSKYSAEVPKKTHPRVAKPVSTDWERRIADGKEEARRDEERRNRAYESDQRGGPRIH